MNHQDTKAQRQKSILADLKSPGGATGKEPQSTPQREVPFHGKGAHFEPLRPEVNRVAHEIVDAAYAVHSALGAGLLETIYESCILHELHKRHLRVERQVSLPIIYDGVRLEAGLRLDMVVENCVIVELKSVEALAPVHTAQLLTYLKLSGIRLGLLINFNVPLIRDGIKRVIL